MADTSQALQPLPPSPPYRGYSATWTPVQFSLLSEVMARYSELWGQRSGVQQPHRRSGPPPGGQGGLRSLSQVHRAPVREKRGLAGWVPGILKKPRLGLGVLTVREEVSGGLGSWVLAGKGVEGLESEGAGTGRFKG